LSTLAHSIAVREALRVQEVARIAGVSERTVWYDIKAERLAAIRSPGQPTYVPRSALAAYRTPGEHLLTVQQVASVLHMHPRTVRRYIREGAFVVVRFSPRCLRIDTKRTLLPKCYDWRSLQSEVSMAAVIAYWRREDLNERQRHRRRVRAWERRRQQLIADGIRFLVRHAAAPPTPGDLFLSARELAHFSGKSVRQVYHDASKTNETGTAVALRVYQLPHRGRRVWIRWNDAIAYWPAATAAIVQILVIELCRYGGPRLFDEIWEFDNGNGNRAVQMEISLNFAAWLTAHPHAGRSAR
jgi:predicted DNA-binding transcriptional regulator AlpA